MTSTPTQWVAGGSGASEASFGVAGSKTLTRVASTGSPPTLANVELVADVAGHRSGAALPAGSAPRTRGCVDGLRRPAAG